MTQLSPNDLLICAIEAARAAGSHALANAHRRNELVMESHHDVKLQLDLECQEKAIAVIHAAYPDHAILAEEETGGQRSEVRGQRSEVRGQRSEVRGQRSEARGQRSEVRGQRSEVGDQRSEVRSQGSVVRSPWSYQWIIDPIDGTVNFSRGLSWWCSSVAVRSGENTLAGAVYAPALGELYTAAADGPACLNDKPIHVSSVDSLDKAIVMTGMDRDVNPGLPPHAIASQIASAARRTRVMGSAAYDMCQVACGRADGYFEAGIYIWDIAAAGLIVERAGGQHEILAEQSKNRLLSLATNNLIHEGVRLLIADATGRRCNR